MLVRLKSGTLYDAYPIGFDGNPNDLMGKTIKNGKPFGPLRQFKRSAVAKILNPDGSVMGEYLLDDAGKCHGIVLANRGGLSIPHQPIEEDMTEFKSSGLS